MMTMNPKYLITSTTYSEHTYDTLLVFKLVE